MQTGGGFKVVPEATASAALQLLCPVLGPGPSNALPCRFSLAAMDALYSRGVLFAEMLQTGPPWLERFWLSMTFLADPKCIFVVFFPLAYFLDRKVGVAVLWIGLVSEWLNVVAKWILFGERPFWWVYESGFSSKEKVLLRQFPVSCETGPGSPSGHCMITGAALWPIVTALTALASRHSTSRLVKLTPFLAYFLLLLAVGLSRIFILAHFPHQVLGGIVAGAALGWMLEACVPAERKLSFYLATSLALLLSAIGLYWSMVALGVDIDWSPHPSSGCHTADSTVTPAERGRIAQERTCPGTGITPTLLESALGSGDKGALAGRTTSQFTWPLSGA
ncbi:glucose-6-phosphatase 3 isoform X3 [Gopherus evgoodei]|uniref:glucose-6-phosphatase 3 isoform X3 n=1 Tax=Gopherus evgoodei TaxID=1825980 RepID=UPI0011CF8B6E|nr:glucose-6-phosphatase 3 isoform X3 [Gopherus evgoodei]